MFAIQEANSNAQNVSYLETDTRRLCLIRMLITRMATL